MKQRNISIPEDLWKRAREAAIREALESGGNPSTSEWIREAMRQRLQEEGG